MLDPRGTIPCPGLLQAPVYPTATLMVLTGSAAPQQTEKVPLSPGLLLWAVLEAAQPVRHSRFRLPWCFQGQGWGDPGSSCLRVQPGARGSSAALHPLCSLAAHPTEHQVPCGLLRGAVGSNPRSAPLLPPAIPLGSCAQLGLGAGHHPRETPMDTGPAAPGLCDGLCLSIHPSPSFPPYFQLFPYFSSVFPWLGPPPGFLPALGLALWPCPAAFVPMGIPSLRLPSPGAWSSIRNPEHVRAERCKSGLAQAERGRGPWGCCFPGERRQWQEGGEGLLLILLHLARGLEQESSRCQPHGASFVLQTVNGARAACSCLLLPVPTRVPLPTALPCRQQQNGDALTFPPWLYPKPCSGDTSLPAGVYPRAAPGAQFLAPTTSPDLRLYRDGRRELSLFKTTQPGMEFRLVAAIRMAVAWHRPHSHCPGLVLGRNNRFLLVLIKLQSAKEGQLGRAWSSFLWEKPHGALHCRT